MVSIGRSHGVQPPPDIAILARTLMGLESSIDLLDTRFATIDIIEQELGRLTTAAVTNDRSTLEALVDAVNLAENVPSRANRILDDVANGDFKITIDALDEVALTTSIEKVADRITAGAILSAMLVSAAMLMRVETGPQLWGYPTPGVLLFLSSGVGILGLLLHSNIVDFTQNWRNG